MPVSNSDDFQRNPSGRVKFAQLLAGKILDGSSIGEHLDAALRALAKVVRGQPQNHAARHRLNGGDSLASTRTPLEVGIGGTGTPGSGEAFMSDDAQLVVRNVVANEGDIYINDGGGPAALPIGAAGTILRSNGSTPEWGLVGVRGLYGYDQHEWRDQFLASSVDASEAGVLVGTKVGQLNWRGPLYAQVTDLVGETSHPGITNLASDVAVGSSTPMFLSSLVMADVYQATAIVRIPDETALGFRFGILRSVGGTGDASEGNYFSYLASASPNWFAVTRDGGGITATDTGVPVVAGTWYLLEIREDTPGQKDYYINGAGPVSNSTNVEVRDGLPVFEVETEAPGVAKAVDVDFFWMSTIAPLGAQFP